MIISVIDEKGYLTRELSQDIKSTTKQILNYLKFPEDSEICITFIDDIEMREMNNSYRNIDRTTDILSFSQYNPEGTNSLLGDLVISYETTSRHSIKYEVTIKQEIKKLLIHGVLHLIGHDHKKKKEREIMREKEKEIANALS